jgi:hypothetical protein
MNKPDIEAMKKLAEHHAHPLRRVLGPKAELADNCLLLIARIGELEVEVEEHERVAEESGYPCPEGEANAIMQSIEEVIDSDYQDMVDKAKKSIREFIVAANAAVRFRDQQIERFKADAREEAETDLAKEFIERD